MLVTLECTVSELAASLALKIDNNPEIPQNIIVRVSGDMDECEEQLSSRGFEIRRKLALIRGFAATATGSQVQELANESWVTFIEEDLQVQAL
jgi:hypothetical protein